MPYRICKSIEIQTGHMLSKHDSSCRFPHGHTRKVELVLEAPDLDDLDMVCDFGRVKQALNALLDRYDHALCVNTRDPMFPVLREAYGERVVAFEDCDPTSEVLARRLFDAVSEYLAAAAPDAQDAFPGVRLTRVRVWESTSSWAEFEPDPRSPSGELH